MNTQEQSRFVIVAHQRTGSNMLVSALDSHPGVRCHGELFRTNVKSYNGGLKVIALLDVAYHDDAYQEEHWKGFLDDVVAASGRADAVGFKLMLNQSELVRNALIADPGYKKILLKRDNMLSVYSSHKIAKETGQGSARRTAEIKKARVLFDPKQFERFCKRYQKRYSDVENALEASGQEFFRTSYMEVIKPEVIRDILEYIGADRELEWEVGTKKRNSPVLTERFSNPEEVEQYLAGIDRLDWLRE